MTGRYVWELSASVWARDWSIDLWINGNADESPVGGGTLRSEGKTHRNTHKVIHIIPDRQLPGSPVPQGPWIWKNRSALKTLYEMTWNSRDFFIFFLLTESGSWSWVLIPGPSPQHLPASKHTLMRLCKTTRSCWEVAQIDKSERGVCVCTSDYWYTLMHRHKHMQSVTHPSPVFTCLYT